MSSFLTPRLVPLASCYVNLPRSFIQTYIHGADHGAVILELSWETLEGYVQHVCVGWIGGRVDDRHPSDAFEISEELARCVGLKDYVEKMEHALVSVCMVEEMASAAQVQVEPCTADDWELVQLHANELENEFLRQTCVVNDQQVLPVWIRGRIVIHFQVQLPVGVEYSRISTETEIVVAPKERVNEATDEDATMYFEACPVLTLQEPRDGEYPTFDQVWVHPELLATLDGALSHHVDYQYPVAAIWNEADESSAPKGSERKQEVRCGVARIVCSQRIAKNHIIVPPAIAVQLHLHDSTIRRVRVRVVRLPPRRIERLRINVLPQVLQPSDSYHVLDDITRGIFSSQRTTIVSSGSLWCIPIEPHLAPLCGAIEVQYQDDEISFDNKNSDLQDFPIGAFVEYSSIETNLTSDQIQVQSAEGVQLRTLQLLRQMTTQTSSAASVDSRFELSRLDPAYDEFLAHLRGRLSRSEIVAHSLFGASSSGSILLCGDRGSGKSALLGALAYELSRDTSCVIHNVLLECRELRGHKMEQVKEKLTDVFMKANDLSPALVILDDIDALVPEEHEGIGAVNEQSRRIAEHIGDLLEQNRNRRNEAMQELRASVFHEQQQIKERLTTKDQKQGLFALLEAAGLALQRKTVEVVATCRSEVSIHKVLRGCGLFDQSVSIVPPNADQREHLIDQIFRVRSASASSQTTVPVVSNDIDFASISAQTEGYCLRDLTSVVDRALHCMLVRHHRAKINETPQLQENDITQGLEGFKPSALLGVDLFKSSIEWNDVGGLHSVRSVLKDTLELPTRFARLFAQSPLRLPAGLLLYGPPGCGKTLLASAVANECALNFLSVKGPEVLNKYIGASEQAIRDLFARAAAAAPSVLFLDEFDAIAPRRGADNTGVTDRLVNQLLTFLDGVEARSGVYVLAATSRPDMIDPALLRPGRLDKSLYCGFPNAAERFDILRAVSRRMEMADDAREYLSDMAKEAKSNYFSGADLQAVVYSAQLELVHEKLANPECAANTILKRHLEIAFAAAKSSTSESMYHEYEKMYARFSKARNTDFSVAVADATADTHGLQTQELRQRTALA